MSRLIYEQAAKYGEKTALSYRDYDLGKWIPISWNSFLEKVKAVSRSMIALGVEVQENVAVFSQNMPECLITDFGAFGVRAVTIPFYATSSSSQITYMVNDASVRYVFVGQQQQYDTALRALAVCPTLEKIIIFDPKVKKNDNDNASIYFSDFLKLGDDKQEWADEAEKRSQVQNYDDLANILYTSGTTGESKGVMLTYGMYHEGFRVNDAVLELGEDDVFLSFLPFTHVFERAWSYLGLTEGAQLAVNLVPQDILRSLQEVHPTCMSAVPRFWEKVYLGVQEKLEKGSSIERKIIKNALRVGEKYHSYKAKQQHVPFALAFSFRCYEKTIIKLLRKTLGLERGNFFPTAGATISKTVENFVHAAGINMIAGYGLTESTATVSCDHLFDVCTIGSVGRLIDGLEIKFGENEEILLRGKTITPGYYKKEEANKAAFDADGWFHTGDAGYLKDGELFLKERIKDLFKTSNGKYIAPQMIEAKLVVDKYIDQVTIIADKRKFVSALVVPDYKALEEGAKKENIPFNSREDLCNNPEVIKRITSRIALLQQDLANYEKIKRFVLLPEPFTIENGELTNTLKIKRRVVYEHYKDLIQKMYDDAEKAMQANK